MSDQPQTTDPVGAAIREIIAIDINDHISLRAILTALATDQRAAGFQDGARWAKEMIRGEK